MAKKVLSSDLVQEKLFQDTIESADLLIAKLTELNKEFKTTANVTKEVLKNSKLDSVKSMNDLVKATEQATKLQKEQIKVENELAKAIQLREKVSQEQLKTQQQKAKLDNEVLRGTIAQTKETERQAKEQEKQARATEKEARAQSMLESRYARVNSWLNKLRNEYRDLAIKKELGLQLTAKEEFRYGTLEKRITSYDSALKKVDASMGNHQRNVGNYASGWNGLSNSVNQLTREMPAFANSVQTGFMAISNNLPMFFDELQKIKKANIELKAQGIQTQSALTQLGSSIFSWGTALSVAVTLLTLYGAKLFDVVANYFKPANKELEEMNKKQKRIQEDSKKQAEYIGKESAMYVGLVLALKQTNKGSQERTELIKTINDQYGTTLQNLKDEKQFQDQLNNSVQDYINFKKAEFLIKKSENLIALNLAKQDTMRNELKTLRETLLVQKASYDIRTKGLQDFNKAQFEEQLGITKTTQRIAELEKALQDADRRLQYYGLSIGKNKAITDEWVISDDKKTKSQKELNLYTSKYLEILAKLIDLENKRGLTKNQDALKKEVDKQIENVRTTGEGELTEIERLLQEQEDLKTKALEENLNASEEVRRKEYESKLKELEKDRDLYKKGTKEYEAYQDSIAELNHDYDTQGVLAAEEYKDDLNKITKEGEEEKNGIMKALSDEWFKYYGDQQKKKDDEELKRKEEFYKNINALAKASADFFILQSQNRVKQIDKELEALGKQQNFLEQMAINGNITAEKSLLQNEKLQAEATKKKVEEMKKQENIKIASSVFEAYSKNAGDKNVKNPVVKTISDISVLQAFIQSLSTFYEGTDTTVGEALGQPHMAGKDGYIVRVDKDEKILNPTLSKMTGNMTTKEIAQIAEDRRMGKLMYQHEGATQLSANWQTGVLVSELQGLRKAIEDKPVSNVEVGEIIGGVMHIVETVTKGNTITRNRMRIS